MINATDTAGASTGLTFEYKAGLKEIQRITATEKSLVTRLYAYGSKRNIDGSYRSGEPRLIFDDGGKTYIQMPPMSERVDLPILYILRNSQKQLVNYRYKRPYYIIDGLFKTAYLISGKGSHQVKVIIRNRNFG